VWLLVVVPLILRELPKLNSPRKVAAIFGCALGVLIVGAPDPYGFAMMSPFGKAALNGKYVVGELLCLAGLMGLWKDDE
jgi:drug/metabolite transporter (DMT)-like permease